MYDIYLWSGMMVFIIMVVGTEVWLYIKDKEEE